MKSLLGSVCLLLAAASLPALAHAGEPSLGEAHPEVRLPTIDGRETLSLHAQRGTKILLIQFASW